MRLATMTPASPRKILPDTRGDLGYFRSFATVAQNEREPMRWGRLKEPRCARRRRKTPHRGCGKSFSGRMHRQAARAGCPSGTARRLVPPLAAALLALPPYPAPVSCAAWPSCEALLFGAPLCAPSCAFPLYDSLTVFSPASSCSASSCSASSCPTSSSLSAFAPPVTLPKRRDHQSGSLVSRLVCARLRPLCPGP